MEDQPPLRDRARAGYSRRLDDSARAGWLYYVAGYKQDEIARMMRISRQTAQRLVSLATKEKLIRFRLEHPIMECMALAEKLTRQYGLRYCEVVPSIAGDPESTQGLAQAGAAAMENELSSAEGRVVAVGTGRTLRACVDELSPMNRPDHTLVALLGHTMRGGLSTPFNIVVRMADRINAAHYPMPLPILAQTAKERELYRFLETVKQIYQLAAKADVTFVGLGNVGPNAPLLADGFLSKEDVDKLVEVGAIGEITSWMFDEDGNILEGFANERVNSVPLKPHCAQPVYCVAAGESRARAIRGAMRGGLFNCLITNETTAAKILSLPANARKPR